MASLCWGESACTLIVSGLNLIAGISLKYFVLFLALWVSCFLQRRQNIPPFAWKTSHQIPVSGSYASGLLSIECWNFETFSVGDLTLYTSSQVCLILHRFCWCTSTSGKVLFNIIVSLSLSQEDWEGPLLVWGLFRKAVFEEEQLGFSLSLLLAGIGSQFVTSDRLSSSMVACVRISPKDTSIFVNSFLLNDHCCLCSKLTLSRILWTSVCRW